MDEKKIFRAISALNSSMMLLTEKHIGIENLKNKISKSEERLSTLSKELAAIDGELECINSKQQELLALRSQLGSLVETKSEFGRFNAAIKWLISMHPECAEMTVGEIMNYIGEMQLEIKSKLEAARKETKRIGLIQTRRFWCQERLQAKQRQLTAEKSELESMTRAAVEAERIINNIDTLLVLKEGLKDATLDALEKATLRTKITEL